MKVLEIFEFYKCMARAERHRKWTNSTNLNKKLILEPAPAADNYPFMVLTAYLLDKDLYNGVLLDMLNNEKKLTSRIVLYQMFIHLQKPSKTKFWI